MNKIAKYVALAGLALTILPPLLLFLGLLDQLGLIKQLMLAGMLLWFAGGIPWLALRRLQPTDLEVEI